MQIKRLLTLLVSLCFIATISCALQGGDDYSNKQERKAMTIQRGKVTEIRTVKTSNSLTLLI